MSKSSKTGGQRSIAHRLRMFITMHRMSIRAFADRFDVPYRTVHQWLSGRSIPGTEHLAKMAERGLNVHWLLTGRMLPQITFDLSNVNELVPVDGDVLADTELANALMHEAAFLVDELVAERPELAAKMGFVGMAKSTWAVFAYYAAGFETNADLIERARAEGWQTSELAQLVTGTLREETRAKLRRGAAKIISQSSKPDDRETTSDALDAA